MDEGSACHYSLMMEAACYQNVTVLIPAQNAQRCTLDALEALAEGTLVCPQEW